MSYGTVQANLIQGSVNSFSPNSSIFRNRIINGAMVIDQRNAGASVTVTGNGYSLDRWQTTASQSSKYSVQQNAGSVTPPIGFKNYLGVTSLSAYSVGSGDYFSIAQRIEGFNTADLDFGTANAKTVTLSFWVRSSLTGTFGGALSNGSYSRSYPYTYTISSANTWEYKTVTIAGDTTGTWVGATNGIGLIVEFGLGVGTTYSGTAGVWASGGGFDSATGAVSVVGTNGATWYVTGVQLEVGSTATSFDYRPYGTELALCQRYYYKIKSLGSGYDYTLGYAVSSTVYRDFTPFPVTMRTNPTSLEQTGTASDYSVRAPASTVTCSAVPFYYGGITNGAITEYTVASGLTTGQGSSSRFPNVNGYVAWSAEL
jgi:hypothetical protein